MTATPSQLNAGRTLASYLADRGPLAVRPAVELVRKLAGQVAALHATGRIHGVIRPDAVSLDDEFAPALMMSECASVVALDDGEGMALLPELQRLVPPELPTAMESARERLLAAGIALDPRQVDVCQLGALLCRLLTGESASAYLRSARVKGKVPAELRPLLESTLGCDGRKVMLDAGPLLVALNAYAYQPTARVETAAPQAISAQESSAEPESHLRSTGDTTPSFVASHDDPADTAVSHAEPAAAQPPERCERDSEALPFTRLGHYEIVARIGHGGMGDVYRGYERTLDRTVAIKVLPPDLSRSQDFVRRFKAEATAAARLIHPHIVQIYFIGEDAGHHFFAMQFIEGESLAGLLNRRGKLPVDEALALVEQVLSGLSAAHRQGLVHRDIKPGNVLLDREQQRALLGDFGLVKSLDASETGRTATGVVMGTVDYISPEQGRGQAVDGRSDLYSVGVLLFQMLSGRLPFEADTPTALIFQHVYEPPPSLVEIEPQVSIPLAAVVAKLLAKSPPDRYASPEELLVDLRAVRSGAPLPSGADRAPIRPANRERAPDGWRATTIVQVPQFNEYEDLPGESLEDLRPLDWWEGLRERSKSLFRRHAPEVLKQLQNTQQQVDGAVAEYARRERKLKELVHEAEGVLGELLSQAAAQRTAARQAQDRVRQAGNATETHAAQAAELACRQAATELERQAADQEEQLGTMRLRLAQVNARLQELRNQRDILRARLKAAGVSKLIDGGMRTRHPLGRPKTLVASLTAAALAIAAYSYFGAPNDGDVRKGVPPQPEQASGKGREAASANPSSGVPQMQREFPTDLLALPIRHLERIDGLDALAFTPDGRRLLAVSRSRSFQAWISETWTTYRPVTVEGAGKDVDWNAVAISPDRQRVATGTRAKSGHDAVIQIWRTEAGKLVRTISEKFAEIHSLAFRPDGDAIAAVCTSINGDESLRQWSAETGALLGQLALDATETRSVAYHPAGDRLAVAGRGPAVSLYDLRSESIAYSLPGLKGEIGCLAFSPDGKGLVTGNAVGDVALWDVASGQRLGSYMTPEQAIATVAFSPDGKWLAAAGHDAVYVWDYKTGALRKVLQQAGVIALDFSPKGTFVATSGRSGPVTLWKADFEPESAENVFTDNGLRLLELAAVSTRIIPVDDSTALFGVGPQLCLYDRDLQSVSRRFEGHRSKIRAIAYARTDGAIYTGAEDGTICVWDAAASESVASLEVRNGPEGGLEPVWSLAATADGKRLLIGTDQSVFLWTRSSQMKLERLDVPAGAAHAVDWSPDGRLGLAAGWIGSGGKGVVRVLDIDGRRVLRSIEGEPAAVTDGAFICDGTEFVYLAGGALHWCRTDDAREVRQIASPATTSTTIGRLPDGAYLVVGQGAALSVREATSGCEILRAGQPWEKAPVLHSEFSPDGRFAVSLSAGNILHWVDLFPTRSPNPLPFAINRFPETPNGDRPFVGTGSGHELSWRRMQCDRNAKLQFDGPANAPQLSDYCTDGGWAIVEGRLVHEPGATRTAIDFGMIRDAEVQIVLELDQTNMLFLLAGWDGRDGHLLYKTPHDEGGEWWLCSSHQGRFRSSNPVPLGRTTAEELSTLQLTLRNGKMKFSTAGRILADGVALPPGHLLLGAVDGRRQDRPIRIHSFEVKLQ